jgi:hypothetical protein
MAGGSEPVGSSRFQLQALRLFPLMPCGKKIEWIDVNEISYYFSKILYLKMGSPPGPKCSLDIPSTVWGKIVVSFPTPFRGHRNNQLRGPEKSKVFSMPPII